MYVYVYLCTYLRDICEKQKPNKISNGYRCRGMAIQFECIYKCFKKEDELNPSEKFNDVNIWERTVSTGLPIYIQAVPGGKDLNSGECSIGQTITI